MGGGETPGLQTYIVIVHTYQHMPCLVAIADCTHVHLSYPLKNISIPYFLSSSDCTFRDLVTATTFPFGLSLARSMESTN